MDSDFSHDPDELENNINFFKKITVIYLFQVNISKIVKLSNGVFKD